VCVAGHECSRQTSVEQATHTPARRKSDSPCVIPNVGENETAVEKCVFITASSWLKRAVRRCSLTLLCSFYIAFQAASQTIAFPSRPTNAPTGSEFLSHYELARLPEREAAARSLISSGDVPGFLRQLCPVEVTNVVAGKTNVGKFFVTADYFAVGSDEDYLLMPLTPQTAQWIADSLDCTLPTRRMVDAIYAAAGLKLAPSPIPPGPQMTTLAAFSLHNEMVRTQRAAFAQSHPLGTLVAGHKKDVVISAKLTYLTNRVAICGWHRSDGTPIQPLYAGHSASWVDYSHGIRLVHRLMFVNGEEKQVREVLANPELAGLISDEGVILNSRYPTDAPAASSQREREPPWPAGFAPGGYPGEMVRELKLPRGVRIVINTPARDRFIAGRPTLLIFYALPNGNTIEQTIGKRLQSGDDRRFDIQHIGAQTRFLREAVTNRNVVVAYLENSLRSWPAWRKQNGDSSIPSVLQAVKELFARKTVEVVLTGHSGGGSLTLGYMNTVADIPTEIRRMAFLDSNYAYETTNHAAKLVRWLQRSPHNHLCVLAYHDAVALLDGKPFVSEKGGTWGRSQMMLKDLAETFPFTSSTNGSLQVHTALHEQIQFLLLENPERKILHTLQVERNGFIHAVLAGAPLENRGYEYFGTRAYENLISPQ
jgi:hypothetical protein